MIVLIQYHSQTSYKGKGSNTLQAEARNAKIRVCRAVFIFKHKDRDFRLALETRTDILEEDLETMEV